MPVSDRAILAFSIIMAVISVLAFGFAGLAAWEPWEDEGQTLYGKVTTNGASLNMRPSPLGGPSSKVGDGCWTGFGYDPRVLFEDLNGEIQVRVRDGEGNPLATGKLSATRNPGRFLPDSMSTGAIVAIMGDGRRIQYVCQFEFQIAGLPTADRYSIEVGDRRGPTYPHEELEDMDWTVAFEL